MKFFRIDLLTLLISLFILNSCKNQDTIGLPVNSAGSISGSLTDTATVFANTIPDDSVVTSNLTMSPMGYFNDPVLGTTTANFITDLNLPGVSPTLTDAGYTLPAGTITIDSAVLVLTYANGFYGDSLTSKYAVNVYQLNETVLPSSADPYYANRQWQVNNTLLGSKTFFSRTHDPLKITSVVQGGPDTLVKAPPELRIPINPGFIKTNVFSAPANQLASNLVFKNNVKGLYVTLNPSQMTGPGGIFMLSGSDSLNVYIRSRVGTTIDTAMITMLVGQHASQIIHHYSQPVQNAIYHSTHSDPLIYLQGLAGLRAKISLPYLSNLVDSLTKRGSNNVVINRAELVVTEAPASNIPSYLVPLPRLTLYRLDIAHQRTTIEDATSSDPRAYGSAVFGGFFLPTSNDYHFLVTSYLQDLIKGNTIDYGTYIAPADTSSISSVPSVGVTAEIAARTVAVGNDKSSPYRIKLNIIYTSIPKPKQ